LKILKQRSWQICKNIKLKKSNNYLKKLEKERYERLVKNELSHYDSLLNQQKSDSPVEQLIPRVDAYLHALSFYNLYVKSKMKNDNIEKYLIDHAKSKENGIVILSLGSGTADWEVSLLEKAGGKIRFDVVEVNKKLVEKAIGYCRSKNLDLYFFGQDVNEISIPKAHYDFIVVKSSLHHFVKLEHIFSEIKKGLAKDGKFVVMQEVIGRNNMKLYPETERIAQKIFDILPSKFRFNHYSKKIDNKIPNPLIDSADSFECIRSEEILPLLLKFFNPLEYVTKNAFLTILLDFRYGPNYDIKNPFDKSLVEIIANLDVYYITNQILKPTTLTGIFGKYTERNSQTS